MKEDWSDFERYVFTQLESISGRLSKLEGKAKLFGAGAGLIAAAVVEAIVKGFF